MKKKKVILGIDNFKKLIDSNGYYVDKTLLIKEILDNQDQIILITRPRRFGKTLNLSMLKYFFEIPECRQNNFEDADVSYLFSNLNILKSSVEYKQELGKYPVLYMSFKNAKQSDWNDTLYNLRQTVSREYKRHKYLLNTGLLSDSESTSYKNIMDNKADTIEFTDCILNLTEYLKRYFRQNCFVLIDEYDTPIQAGFIEGYFKEVIDFMKGMLVKGFKDNESLKQGILTGIMKVAQESIFSDFNNPSISTVLTNKYSDKFGFTESEVLDMAKYFNLNDHIENIKNWYNGYVFGDATIIYNPWSIIKYMSDPSDGLKPYWINTSDNRVVKEVMQLDKVEGKIVVEKLLQGDVVKKVIDENITYQTIKDSPESGWSFLLHAGYLKAFNKEKASYEEKYSYNLAIPNLEIKTIYKEMIINYFKEDEKTLSNVTGIIKSLLNNDIEKFERLLNELYLKQVSFYDTNSKNINFDELDETFQDNKFESFHHGFMLGLFVQIGSDYIIESNKEFGLGRPDIVIIPKDNKKLAYIFEFKWESSKGSKTIDLLAYEAQQQIFEKKYKEGINVKFGHNNIICIGIGFKGKKLKLVKC
jgi:hypothetical protein